MFKRIHHIAFLVGGVDDDLEEAMAAFEDNFGVDFIDVVAYDNDFVDIALYRIGETIIELMSPTSEEGWPYRYWSEHGNGFFHIAFEVEDIDESINQLAEQNIGMQTEVYDGVDWQVATMDEDDTFVPMQVVEDERELENRF